MWYIILQIVISIAMIVSGVSIIASGGEIHRTYMLIVLGVLWLIADIYQLIVYKRKKESGDTGTQPHNEPANLSYQEPYQASPDGQPLSQELLYYRKHGKKYKRWAIINMCCGFFIFVFPILAIIESNKAQTAANRETHDFHIKRALIFNLCTYAVLVLFAIIMGILQSMGIVTPS